MSRLNFGANGINAKPISETRSSGCETVAIGILGAVFLAAGLLFFWLAFLVPLMEWNQGRKWASAPATITDSSIQEHPGDDGSSWSAEFEYTYSVDGIEYAGDRYSFLEISGNRRGAVRLQEKHPVGSISPCYYDPAAPANCVLDRTLGWKFLYGLFPLAFALVGGVLLFVATRGHRKKESGRISGENSESIELIGKSIGKSAANPLLSEVEPDASGRVLNNASDRLDSEFDGPLKLKPENSKWIFLAVFGVFCLVWNSIIGSIVFFEFREFNGGWGWLSVLFMVPFVLVGLAMAGFCFYLILGLFNPKIEIALSNGAVPLGSEFDIAWEVIGNAQRIRKLDIRVEGEEAATYRRGTDTLTDTATFEKIEVVSTSVAEEIQFGTATLQIPDNSMYSFDGSHNQIKWAVKVQGEIPWWPDVVENLPFRVRPPTGQYQSGDDLT